MTNHTQPTQKIIHIDMDCFFAAVEMRDFPEYQNVALAVGGNSNERGVISTANYEARKFGVHSSLSTVKAFQLCPHLVVVPTRMNVYAAISKQIRAIFERYTSIIEPLSFDEAFLDVTDSTMLHGSATLMAEAIRRDIESELSLTASAGVAPLKFLAKIASDINKPNGITVITPNQTQDFIDSLPLEKISGVGKVSIEKLHKAGLFTCLDIKQSNYRDLLADFGRLGASLWQRSHGIDPRKVVVERNRKSVGVERTFNENIFTKGECWDIIEDKFYPELERRLLKVNTDGSIAKQSIKIKFADFKQTTVEHNYSHLSIDNFKPLLEEILTRQQGREIRLLGISVVLKPIEQERQLCLI